MNEFIERQIRAEDFESQNQSYTRGQRRALDYFFEGADKGSFILDCACGDGVGLQWFKDNGFEHAVGMEVNPRKAEIANKISPVIEGDMHDLRPYQEECFDFIWSSHSVEHAHKPLTVLRQFYRTLKPGGMLYLVLPYKDTGPLDVHCGQVDLCTNQDTPDAFLKKLDWCGFNVIEWKLDTMREAEIWVKAGKHV